MIKKILMILCIVLLLSGCSKKSETDYKEKYSNLVEALSSHTSFASSSQYFDIEADIAKTNDGYRYYVIVDNPQVAMYGVEIVAVEKGINYMNNMAANVGVLDETEYNMLPGQARKQANYVAGLSVSGVSAIPNPTIYVLVNWHGKTQDIAQEFFEFNLNFSE